VTSSYSGEAMCSSRIFLWESTDQIVISDIDGTITKFVILAARQIVFLIL
jgi:phosphatidate phosphatase LPIN